MKNILAAGILILSLNVRAQDQGELLGSAQCDRSQVDHSIQSEYFVSNDTGDSRVKLRFTLKTDFEYQPWYTTFDTSVIESIKHVGDKIIHQNGSICAEFKKPGLVGYKSWIDSGRCQVVSRDRIVNNSFGPKACIRDYFFIGR